MIVKFVGLTVVGVLNILGLRLSSTPVFESPKNIIQSKGLEIGSEEVLAVEEGQEPKLVEIEAINLRAGIVGVGLDDRKAMIVPGESDLVSWYKPGVVPGEKGSAVLAGHNEWEGPGVFQNLHKINIGNSIRVHNINGNILSFRVTRVRAYDRTKFPLKEVYAQRDKKRLNLITCHGKYDSQTKLYEERLVVYAEIDE